MGQTIAARAGTAVGLTVYPPTERDVQRSVKKVLALCGFIVSDFSQGYRPGGKRHGTTRITKGVPDLYAVHRSLPVRFWLECKTVSGKVSPVQAAWHENERRAGGEVLVVRSGAELAEWLAAKMPEWRRT